LKGRHILLEVTPPSRKAAMPAVSKAIGHVSKAVRELGRVDAINLPEIVEENNAGAPFYRNMDPRDFGVLLRAVTGKRMVVNKVAVHFKDEAEFDSWLRHTLLDYEVEDVVFVGGTNNNNNYPGLSVLEANKRALEFKKLNVGNICIPSRSGEVERLVAKTESGCSFFTTQLLFDALAAGNVIEGYVLECERLGLRPAEFFLSFAPAGGKYDVDFFKWLGAQIPVGVERQLESCKQGYVGESIALADSVLRGVLARVEDRGLRVPLSLNIEAVSSQNLDYAKQMALALACVLDGKKQIDGGERIAQTT